MQNETINAACKNLTGGTPNQAGYPKGTGNLWNGMILPIINMTIKGATWFQVRELPILPFLVLP